MKIAYIHLSKDKSRAHEKRLHALALGSKTSGIDNIEFYYLNKDKHDTTGLVKFIRYREKIFPFNYHDFLMNRYNLIESSMDLHQFDYLILRYPNSDPSGLVFTSKYNVITEHHSKEIQEYQSRLKSNIPFIVKTLKRIRLHLETQFGSRVLSNAKGIIGVTDEIRRSELDRAGHEIPSTTISNGIAVDGIKQTGFKKFDGKSLHIAGIVGSYYPWHGLDRMISAISKYHGNIKVKLHLIGNISKSDIGYLSPDFSRIQFHGYKDGQDLDEVLQDMNIALGALGMYRLNMEEACSLKTREYTARGIPFVMGYTDPDLKNVEPEYDFYFSIENNDSLVDIEKIISFAENVSKRNIDNSLSEYMRSYALKYMDWSVKANHLVEFVEHLNRFI